MRAPAFRSFDFTTMSGEACYRLMASSILPRPIAWVITLSADGQPNAAPYSFFNMFGNAPPVVAIGLMNRPDRPKDTAKNIRDTNEFVINLVPEALVGAMNLTCIDAPPDVDELTLAGLATTPSTQIAPPRILASPVAFECRLLQMVETGPAQTMAIGQVVCAHFSTDIISDGARPHIDGAALDLVGRMHGADVYSRSRDTFTLPRPQWDPPPKPGT